MGKAYVWAAIDHGTSNSAIAVMEDNGPRVIKPDGVNPVMPSVVYINRNGRMLVGGPAYRAILTGKQGEGTGHMRYKIRIGQDDRYEFGEVKKVMSAPELGSIVIGELLKAAREEGGQEIKACVITVPAKFEQSACDGTIAAAQKAGLLYAPLVQEPIAAALAYGFNTQADRAHWMVFDLGGGTLDVSLVFVRNGQMKVPEEGHAGDNRLGGSKFDRELMDYVLPELKKKYSLDGFSENNPQYRSAWGTLLLAIEQAKIVLSNRQEAVVEVEGELCKDNRGTPVKVEVPITRAMYEKKIAPDIEKAVHICETSIKTNRLTPKDIDGLILVGGPTKTPYIQQVLSERLGIRLIKEVDPMTVVAQGGAIYATTLEIPVEIKEQIAGTEIPTRADLVIKLEYERNSKLPKYNVVGKVEGKSAGENGLMVEISRTDGGWSSGRVPIDSNGLFSVEVLLVNQKKPYPSRFTTTVLDAGGQILATINEPEIWYPFPEGGGRVPNSLRVALKGNQTEVLIKGGAELPARGQGKFVTTKTIRKGSKEDILKIPVLETVTHLFGGEDEHADCNVHVGSFLIQGSHQQVTSDLPAGADIELTIEVNESRQNKARAYLPLLEEEFEVPYTAEPFGITVEDVEKRFESEKRRLEQIRKLQAESPIEGVAQNLAEIEKMNVVEDIYKNIERARQGEGDARYRAWTRVLELSGSVNKIMDDQIGVRIDQHLKKIKKGATEKDIQQIDALEKEIEQAQSQPDRSKLQHIEYEVDELDLRIRRRPYYVLALNVAAIAGTMVTNHQYVIHKAGADLLDELDEKGAPQTLTNEDIKRIEEADQKIIHAFPDLHDRVNKFLKGLPPGIEPEDAYGTTVKKKSH